MFERIRWRLVAWSLAVVVVIVGLVGVAMYAYLARSLVSEVDRSLTNRGEELAARLRTRADGDIRLQVSGYRGGVFYLVIDAEGHILDNPQQVDLEVVPLPTGAVAWETVELDAGEARVYIRRFPNQRTTPAYLVVGQSLRPEQGALNQLLLVLVGAATLGLALSCIGGWFLAGRALVPIQHAFRRQREFVADASHELRTPLMILRAATDLLAEHQGEPLAANRELLDDVRAEVARLERLAGDLLTLARSDLGVLGLAVGRVDLGVLAADVVRRTLPLAQARGIALTLRLPDEPVWIEGDPDRLQQVLLILLDNALKYTGAGGQATVTLRLQGGEARLEVRDSGEGIAPEHLARIFDRFYRAEAGLSRAADGAGLGLAIARSLAAAHGGTLSLASTVGVGTTAMLRLPLADQAPSLAGRLGRLAAAVLQRPAAHRRSVQHHD